MVFGIIAVGLNFIFSTLNYFVGSPHEMASRISSSRGSTVDTSCDSIFSGSRKSRSLDQTRSNLSMRLDTFGRMPTPHNVGPSQLAESGFFYSKSAEGTRCTGCKKVVKEWNRGDRPDDRCFHRRGCKFIRGNEPLVVSRKTPEHNEPEPMEDSPAELPATGIPVEDTKQAASLPVKIFPGKYTQQKSPINLTQMSKTDSASSAGGTDDFPIRRLTPVDLISNDDSPLPNFTQSPNRNGHIVESEPINRNSNRGRNRPTTYQQNHPSSGARAAALPEEIAGLDMRVSKNRLETFRRFWSSRNVFKNVQFLVLCGFFCLGQGDAVQCFCCGAILANWSRNDDARRRHIECSPQCRFARGLDSCGDIPLPVSRRDHSRDSRGDISLPDARRDHSHSSRHSTSARGRHSHMPHTRSSSRNITRAATVPSETSLAEAYANMTPSQRERNNLMLEFPCANAANEAMRDERMRLQSFQNSSFRSYTQLRKSNETLAQAGLYYDGVGDCTRCWYCGGGLKEYLPNDDPWVEHAKYYPECEYLLQQRGPAWVTSISIQHPNIQRPPHPQQMLNSSPSSGTMPVVESSNTPGRSVLDEAMTTQPVAAARRAGFTEQQIRQVQQRRMLALGSCYQTAEALIEALLNPDADPSTIDAATSPPVAHMHQTINAQPFQPGPRPQRQNIVIAGGNFVGPNALEAAAASAQQNPGMHQSAGGQPQRRNIVISGGTFLGPSIINGRLYRGSQIPQTTSSTTTINNQPLEEFLANQGEPMEVQTVNGTMRVYNNVSGNTTSGGSSSSTQPAVSTSSSPSSTQVAASTVPALTPSTSSPTTTSTTTSSRPAGSAEERLEALERERLCKICLNAPAQILFQPCGHVCACVDCARRVTDCPVCRRRIVRYVRIYPA